MGKYFDYINNTKKIINTDRKTIRGAKQHVKKLPIHMVSPWACENNLVLDQVKVNEKSNEITAIPELLEILSIENSIITIDEMGCQKEIASKIIEQKADYVLAFKENQAHLYENIEDEFRFSNKIKTSQDVDCGHGRIETRKCWPKFSVLNKIALNLLKNDKTSKVGIKEKRKKAVGTTII